MSEVATVENPYVPLSGTLQFTASGVGAFETPNYDVRGRVDSLFMSEEEIGQVTGRIGVRNEELEIEIEAASPRLAISALGRVALTTEGDAELAFRFTDTALDPYIRFSSLDFSRTPRSLRVVQPELWANSVILSTFW